MTSLNDRDLSLRALRSVEGLPHRGKQALMALWDLCAGFGSIWAAHSLRPGTGDPVQHVPWTDLVVPALLVPPIFWAMGLYREITRYIGTQYVWRLAQACVLVSLVLGAALFLSPDRHAEFPWRAPLVAAVLLWGASGGVRLLSRQALRQRIAIQHRVAILGASDVGAGLGAALSHDRLTQVVAYFDDAPKLRGGSLRGVRIHPTESFDAVLRSERFDSLLVALGPASRSKRRQLVEHAAACGVRVLSVPTLADIKDGRVSVGSLRPLSIEDLLGRPSATPIPELLGADVVGRNVLVTGAGGSIGSELCRQVLALGPKSLILVDNSEFNLFEMDRQLREQLAARAPGSVRPAYRGYLASVTDAVRMDRILAEHRPHTIYHAAAYKHVPLVEDNEAAGAEVNVLGTLRVAEAAVRHGVESFVLVSTDKAVRPTSVMGATKRMAEMVLQALQARLGAAHGIRFTMVRFGNVLGSSGSVVPIFRQQIERGGPVTVTHPDVKRYFMSIPEAVQLILQAGAMGEGGDVFVLDMGEPVRIVDLARNMIRLAGHRPPDAAHPNGDIEIVFTGLRPGEKMFEELVIGAGIEKTRHAAILRAREGFMPWHDLDAILQRLEAATSQHDAARVRQLVAVAVAAGADAGTGRESVPAVR